MTGSLLPALLLLALAAEPAEDGDLARRIRQGDRRAFRAFFERYHGPLYRFLRARAVPAAVCEDLIQNAFLAIWERRDRIDEARSLRALLFKSCYNRALNHFRDTARFAGTPPPERAALAPTPDRHAEAALIQAALDAAVAALPERRRAVFELCFLEELTYREAADALGISVKTVENQMGHALKAIRRALAAYH